MKKLAMAIFSMVAILAFTGSLYAAGEAEKQPDMQNQAGAIINTSANDYIGMPVLSQDGEKIGKIRKVAVDEATGDIRFFTLEKGGVLGMGASEVAVPLGAIRFDEESAFLTVDTSMLDNAPKQANLSNEAFTSELETYYGAAPEWEKPSGEMDMDESEPAKSD